MFSKLKFLFFYFTAWLLFFELMRLVFVLYHFNKAGGIPLAAMLGSFWHGLRMDLSIAAYILLPVCAFVLLSLFIHFFRRLLIYRIYTLIVLLLVCLISMADLELYNAWGFRIDSGPLRFLSTPKEVLASVWHLPLFWILLVFFCGYLLFYFCFRWLMRFTFFQQQNKGHWVTGLVILLLMGSLILPIRGGWQLAPLNQSAVYFSKHQFANHSAVNASWNFMHSLLSKANVKKNPYNYLPVDVGRKMVDSLYSSSGNAEKWVAANDSLPVNVVLVIWESFTAKAVESSYEGVDITPGFNQLLKEGIYFSNLYASGDRTNKGVPAILSGYPAMPNTTIIHNPAKSVKLPTLTHEFAVKGYETSFIYGGEPEFANIKSYLVHAGFHQIIGKNDFNAKDMNSKWGAHDGVVMQRALQELDRMQQPFFTTWLTLSSHEPFETPDEPAIKGSDNTSRFLNSIHYTDKVLGAFVDSCRRQPWWNNTILIITGDHGHPLPAAASRADDFRTPMLWLGGALQRAAFRYPDVASQLDLAATLLKQLDMDAGKFVFSKNLADRAGHRWAFFNFNDGFGWVDANGRLLFDNVGKRVIATEGHADSRSERAGKAMQQATFQDFVDK